MKFFLPALGACIVGTSSVFGAIHITDTIDEHGCQTASGYQFQPSTGLCVTPDGQSYDPATTFFPQSVGGTWNERVHKTPEMDIFTWAKNKNITTTDTIANFRYYDTISREEVAAVISRISFLDHLKMLTRSGIRISFVDAADIAPEFYSVVSWAEAKGIFRGDINKRFRPKDTISVYETLLVLIRSIHRLHGPDDVLIGEAKKHIWSHLDGISLSDPATRGQIFEWTRILLHTKNDELSAFVGTWKLTGFAHAGKDMPLMDTTPSTLTIDPTGQVIAKFCNNWEGYIDIHSGTVSGIWMWWTEKTCPDTTLMFAETHFSIADADIALLKWNTGFTLTTTWNYTYTFQKK